MSINMFPFLAWILLWFQSIQGTFKVYLQSKGRHWKSLCHCLFLSFLSLPPLLSPHSPVPPVFPYQFLLHVFTTAWDTSCWHVRASWILNSKPSIVSPKLQQFENVMDMNNSEWQKNDIIFRNMFQLVFWHRVTEKYNIMVNFLFQSCNTAKQLVVPVSLICYLCTYDPVVAVSKIVNVTVSREKYYIALIYLTQGTFSFQSYSIFILIFDIKKM